MCFCFFFHVCEYVALFIKNWLRNRREICINRNGNNNNNSITYKFRVFLAVDLSIFITASTFLYLIPLAFENINSQSLCCNLWNWFLHPTWDVSNLAPRQLICFAQCLSTLIYSMWWISYNKAWDFWIFHDFFLFQTVIDALNLFIYRCNKALTILQEIRKY